MTVVTWDTMAKKVDDKTTIQELLDSSLLAHNQDPSAHSQADEPIYEHRTDEQLDHLDGSVGLKHLYKDSILIMSCFESLDGWTLAGNKSINIFSAGIYTNATANHISSISMWDTSLSDVLNFSKNPFFQTTAYIDDTTNIEVYILCGRYQAGNNNDSFGFKYVSGTLYAVWTYDEDEYTQEISGIDVTVRNVYRAVIDSVNDTLTFYVNGTVRHTLTADLPNVNDSYMFNYRIKTLENVRKDMHFSDLMISVGR